MQTKVMKANRTILLTHLEETRLNERYCGASNVSRLLLSEKRALPYHP